ncbi:MAG: response regulator transcription factor [Phycisphaeraceae bacterium]
MSRILIVDDEAPIRHIVALKLRSAGHEVVVADDGEEGLALAREHQPDLVVADYQMPFMSGMAMAVSLREDPSTCTVPVLLLTARSFKLPPEELMRANIAAVLGKPFSPRDLVNRVETILNSTSPAETETVR